MSQDNVDVVRRAWAAWLRGDRDGVFDWLDPDVEWNTATYEGFPEAGVARGQATVRRFMDQWADSWERYEAEADEFIDAADDRVVVLARQRGYGPDSQAPVEMQWAQVCTLRDGLVVRVDAYAGWQAALDAAVLR